MKRFSPAAASAPAALLALFAGASSAKTSSWTLTDLGTLGGTFGVAAAINGRGQIIGDSTTASGEGHAFLWQGGKMTDLGTLGETSTSAAAINDGGQVVGTSLTAAGSFHAFLWERGKMMDLGTLGGASSGASAINQRGQVVGSSDTSAGVRHASPWERGQMVDLGIVTVFPGFEHFQTSGADAMADERGQVVGSSWLGVFGKWFLWEDGKISHLGFVGDAVGLGGGEIAINNRGQATFSGGGAQLWEKGTSTDLRPTRWTSRGQPAFRHQPSAAVRWSALV